MKFIYGKAKEAFGKALIDLLNDDLRTLLVKTTYTPSQNVDEFLDDIASGDRVTGGLSGQMTTPSFTLGEFNADDVPYTALTAGVPAGVGIVIIQYTGSEPTSRLIFYSNEGLTSPAVPTGPNLDVIWPSPIFAL